MRFKTNIGSTSPNFLPYTDVELGFESNAEEDPDEEENSDEVETELKGWTLRFDAEDDHECQPGSYGYSMNIDGVKRHVAK